MKKVCCMMALAAISFGSVFAHGITPAKADVMQTDTAKKKVKVKNGKIKTKKKAPVKKDTTVKIKM
jgi:hypothetical protein